MIFSKTKPDDEHSKDAKQSESDEEDDKEFVNHLPLLLRLSTLYLIIR